MTTAARRIRALGDWVDSRTGARGLLAAALDEPIPGGARWAYVFGSALFVTLVLQAVSGVLLTVYYAPTVDHAHTTVAYIQKEAPLGWLVRGVHYYGASAVIVVLLLHLAQTFVCGAYKERREALWLVGVVLLNVLLAFGFTGYLLPWDQKAYFGTGVAGGIAGSVPAVGRMLADALVGSGGVGQATLSRFFSLHVFVLPAVLAVLVVVHVYLFRYVGPAGPASDLEPSRERTERFFPRQFFKDSVAAVAVVVVVVALSLWRPAVLGPKADPSSAFVPRPEWYFLWTFELLKVMPAFVGAVLVPGALMTALALAPFVDRSPSRSPRARKLPIAAFGFVLAAIAGLTVWSLAKDARDPQIARQEERARDFMRAPFVPDEIGAVSGQTAAAPEPPAAYSANCAACHGARGEGQVGPSLVGVTSKPNRRPEDLVSLIENPRRFGLEPAMPAFPQLSVEDRRAIAEWVAGLGEPAR